MSLGSDAQARLAELRAALEAGWQIVEPVVQRTVYYTTLGRVCALELVLHSADERRLIALEDAPEVQRLLQQRRLAVIDLA